MMCAARFFFTPLSLSLSSFLLPFSGSQGGLLSIAHLSPTSVRGFLFFLRMVCVCWTFCSIFATVFFLHLFLFFFWSVKRASMMMVIMQSTVFTALNLCECVCECYVVAPKTIISPVFACARSFDRVFPSLRSLYCSFPIAVSYASRCLNLETIMNERWMWWWERGKDYIRVDTILSWALR